VLSAGFTRSLLSLFLSRYEFASTFRLLELHQYASDYDVLISVRAVKPELTQ